MTTSAEILADLKRQKRRSRRRVRAMVALERGRYNPWERALCVAAYLGTAYLILRILQEVL
jgi:hypothetical protein